MLLLGWEGGRGSQEGDDICIIMADLCCCMSETNTILWTIFLQLKTELKQLITFDEENGIRTVCWKEL